ncbi:unnamed protein product [Microthlaspi erraticum]|uniref:Uncharacterized protein n=1 Tax=Microthlaspi erraticum TaxID=1685480 RepID=A0A6D2LBR4_9BRAS|nr:unnamed protein product [Microthlaspi erraticum]
MDFIKTTSPGAMSELTFQRKCFGIIWMSRNEVMIKLVKTGPDGLTEQSRSNRAHRPTKELSSHDRPAQNVRVPSRRVHGRAHVPTREASSRGRPVRVSPPQAAHDRTARTGKHGRTTVQHFIRATRTSIPSDQEGFVQRPAISFDQTIHPAEPDDRTTKLSATIDPILQPSDPVFLIPTIVPRSKQVSFLRGDDPWVSLLTNTVRSSRQPQPWFTVSISSATLLRQFHRFTVRSHCSPPASMEPRKFNGKWDCHASSSSEGLLANSTPCQWQWATCSLGSAVATLLAIELSSSQLAKRGAITVTTYHKVKDSWRVVNHRDIIPTVPRLLGYCHVAHPVYPATRVWRCGKAKQSEESSGDGTSNATSEVKSP